MGIIQSFIRIKFNHYRMIARVIVSPSKEITSLKKTFCDLPGSTISKLKELTILKCHGFFDDVNSLDCYSGYLSIFKWPSHYFNPLSCCDVTPSPPPLRRTPRLLLLIQTQLRGNIEIKNNRGERESFWDIRLLIATLPRSLPHDVNCVFLVFKLSLINRV